jgi:hypothetical protein
MLRPMDESIGCHTKRVETRCRGLFNPFQRVLYASGGFQPAQPAASAPIILLMSYHPALLGFIRR